tara:strand:+ start:618 stop:962 length:345 start_codon:yes stop_codon:yes gene_type:complete
MINNDTVEFYNNRLTYDLSQISKLTTSQKDQVRHYGSQAEALLKHRDLAMFIHHYKFSIADELANMRGHLLDDNTKRVALSNELVGIDNFVGSLKRAVYLKNRLGNTTEVPDSE